MVSPTKQGFEELIKKVNSWNASNGKMTKYTINNLADCQSALVDYIEMQGLAGYASTEAAGTIQGSLAMTKSAWSNLMTGVANESANMDLLIDNFLESVSALAANILPRITTILNKVPSLITGLLPMIPGAIETLLPAVVDGVNSIMAGVASALPAIISSIVSAMGQIISGTFAQMPTPMLIIAGAIGAVTAGIQAYNAVVAIKNIVDKIQESGIKKLVAAQIAQNAAFLASPIFWIIAGIVALVAVFVILWNKCEGFRNFFINMWDNIKNAFSVVVNWIKEAWQTMWNGIKNAFSVVVNWIKENWQTMLLFLINPLAGVFAYCYQHFEGFRNMVNNIISSVINFFSNMWNNIKSMFTNVGMTIANGIAGAFKSVINAVIGFAERVINGFFSNINTAIGFINKIPGVNIPLLATLSLPRLATGGNFDGRHPMVAVVGDAPETMVPHGNTPRNRALLAEAAKGVGVGVGGNNVNITFAPVINGGSGADVRQALRDSEAEFERRMDAYFRKRGRVSFA